MGSLADLILTFFNLLEAEGRTLRGGLLRIFLLLALASLGCLLALAALGLIVWAVYGYLRLGLDQPTAALLTGLIFMFVAGVMTWFVKGISA
jgi:UPF0716 family protein affecting phage T7 exclusion